MAGRLLPVALATFSGIAIGVATFGEELKEQRKKRIEEEYNRDVAAVSALNGDDPLPMASSAIKPPSPEQIPTNPDAKSSKLSSLLGLWAWTSNENHGTKNTPSGSTAHTEQRKP